MDYVTSENEQLPIVDKTPVALAAMFLAAVAVIALLRLSGFRFNIGVSGGS